MKHDLDMEALRSRADEVARLLKTVSHRNRLLIACQLMEGEQSVSDIEAQTGVTQPVLSRELAHLRRDGLLSTRRDSRMIYYRLADERLSALVAALCAAFAPAAKRARTPSSSMRREQALKSVKRRRRS